MRTRHRRARVRVRVRRKRHFGEDGGGWHEFELPDYMIGTAAEDGKSE